MGGETRNIGFLKSFSAIPKQIARSFFSQTSVNKFFWGFSYCPYYQDVCNSEVSARCELISVSD